MPLTVGANRFNYLTDVTALIFFCLANAIIFDLTVMTNVTDSGRCRSTREHKRNVRLDCKMSSTPLVTHTSEVVENTIKAAGDS